MFAVLCLILVVVLGILSCAIAIACDVRAIREKIESGAIGQSAQPHDCNYSGTEPVQAYFDMPGTQASSLEVVGTPGHVDPHNFSLARRFVVWEWRDGAWNVRPGADASSDPGSPPRFPGAFEGDHVKKWTPESSR